MDRPRLGAAAAAGRVVDSARRDDGPRAVSQPRGLNSMQARTGVDGTVNEIIDGIHGPSALIPILVALC